MVGKVYPRGWNLLALVFYILCWTSVLGWSGVKYGMLFFVVN